jgi:hypothetical protein
MKFAHIVLLVLSTIEIRAGATHPIPDTRIVSGRAALDHLVFLGFTK